MVDPKSFNLTAQFDFSNDRGQRPDVIEQVYQMEVDRPVSRLEPMVKALSSSRLLLPVIPHAAPRDMNACPASDDSFVVTDISYRRTALPVFSDLATLQQAYPQARPKPMPTQHVCLAALDRGGRLLLDDTMIIPRPAVAALAQGDTWLPAFRDTALHQGMWDLISDIDGIGGIRLDIDGDCRDVLYIALKADCQDFQRAVNEAVVRLTDYDRLTVATDTMVIMPLKLPPQ